MGKDKNREDHARDSSMAARAPKVYSAPREKLRGKNPEQQKLINLIYESKIVVATGPQGTGKTFPASVIAWDMFTSPQYTDITEITFVRPNESLGPTMGYMKGDLYEKYKYWLAPIEDGLLWRMEDGKVDTQSKIKAKEHYRDLINQEIITPVAVEHLRGRTWNNRFVIVDEAQNLTRKAMKALLGRIGNDCKVVICGDIDQCDLKDPKDSGLGMLRDLYEYANIRFQGRVPFRWIDLTDGVRSAEVEFFNEMFEAIDADSYRERGDIIEQAERELEEDILKRFN